MMKESKRGRSMMEFDDLPEEIKDECLARVHVQDYLSCALFSHKWHKMMSSKSLLIERLKKLRMGREFYVCLANQGNPKWYNLVTNSSGSFLKHLGTLGSGSFPSSMTSIGSDIFVLRPEPDKTSKQEFSNVYTNFKKIDSDSLDERERILLQIPRNSSTFLSAIRDVVFISSSKFCERFGVSIQRDKAKTRPRTRVLPNPPFDDDDELFMAGSFSGKLCLWSWSPTTQLGWKVKFDIDIGAWESKIHSSLLPSTFKGFSHTVLVGDNLIFRTIFRGICWFDESKNNWVPVNGYKKFVSPPLHVADLGRNLIALGRSSSDRIWATELEIIVSEKREGEKTVYLRELWTDISVMQEKQVEFASVSVGH